MPGITNRIGDGMIKQPSAELPPMWRQWIATLGAEGYTVTQGSVYRLDTASCQMFIEYFGTCAGNNPIAPYFIPQLPIVEGQYIDPYYATAFETVTAQNVPVSEFYRLNDNEALVVIIRMPSRAAYLGYQSYIYSRDVSHYPSGSSSTSSSSPSGTSPDPNRVPTFGSIGNAINNVVMQRVAGAHWGDSVVGVVTTSNQNLDRELRMKLDHTTNPNQSHLISEPIGDFAYTGLGQTDDEFLTMMRYALPENAEAGQNWSDNPQNAIWVFRVTDNSGSVIQRFPTPEYTKKSAVREGTLADSQKELAGLLQAYTEATFGYEASTTSMLTLVHSTKEGLLRGQVGQQCVINGFPCSGDNQDTDAYRVANVGTLTGNQTVYVVGVDQTQYPMEAVANATYVSVGVYDAPTLTGVAGVSQTNRFGAGFSQGTLTGSAEKVLKDLGLYSQISEKLKRQLHFFYVTAITRQCPAQAAWCIPITDDQIPEADEVVISQRAYMRLGTTTSGDPTLMLTPLSVRPTSGTKKAKYKGQ